MSLNKVKPRARSRYRQGYVDPRKCKKYIAPPGCLNEPITYRSGLEYRFMQFCEESSQIVKWSPEPVKVPYVSPIDSRQHTYYPDYIVESNTGERAMIEIKPYNQTLKPKDSATMYDKEQYIKNCAKWKAAMEWCSHNGFKFMIVTENFFR